MIGKSQVRECLVRAALATLVAALIGLADPMGLDEATDRHSADVVSRMTAPFYGGDDHRGREQIAVIQISDKALSDMDLSWPAPRSLYGGLLKSLTGVDIGAAKHSAPAVIFLDYAFISHAGSDDQAFFMAAIEQVTGYAHWWNKPLCQSSVLAKIRCMADNGIPVIVGKNYPPNGCLAPSRREDDPDAVLLANRTAVVPLGWPNLPTSAVPVFTRTGYVETVRKAMGDVLPAPREQERLARQMAADILSGRPIRPAKATAAQVLVADCPELNPDLSSIAAAAAYAATPRPASLPSRGAGGGASADEAEAPPWAGMPMVWAPLGYHIGDGRLGDDLPPPSNVLCPADRAASNLCRFLEAERINTFAYDLAPASAMAFALCLRSRDVSELCNRLRAAEKTGQPPKFDGDEPAGPDWGSISDPTNLAVRKLIYADQTLPTEQECFREKANPLRALAVGWSQLTSGLGQGVAARAVPCPYHLTVDVEVFLGNEKVEELRPYFANRAVAIGAAQALTNDWISTPLNARQPGVHYHAMALDNLLENGPRLRQRSPPIFPETSPLGWLRIDWGEALEFGCLLLIALLVEWVRAEVEGVSPRAARAVRYQPLDGTLRERLAALDKRARGYWSRAQPERHKMALVAMALFGSLLVIAPAIAFTVLSRWEPVNIVALLGFAIVFVAFELWSRQGWLAVGLHLAAIATVLPRRLVLWFESPRRSGQRRRAKWLAQQGRRRRLLRRLRRRSAASSRVAAGSALEPASPSNTPAQEQADDKAEP
jgi:hypothetical protein